MGKVKQRIICLFKGHEYKYNIAGFYIAQYVCSRCGKVKIKRLTDKLLGITLDREEGGSDGR